MSDPMPFPEFETLVEVSGLPRFDLPRALERAYGSFGLPEHVVYANVVVSLDGIVAIPEMPRSSVLISGGDPGDRFLMALLRACADAVVIGAGTFRVHRGPWTADSAYPPAGADLAELRRALGLGLQPTLVVLSGSGDLGNQPSKLRGAMVATTARSADDVRDTVGDDAEVMVVGNTERPDAAAVIKMLAERGYRRILTEGGPNVMGQLLNAGIVDELFLTLSPVLVGGGADRPRPTLATGADLLPAGPGQARLLSARGHHSYLYLRYQLNPADKPHASAAATARRPIGV